MIHTPVSSQVYLWDVSKQCFWYIQQLSSSKENKYPNYQYCGVYRWDSRGKEEEEIQHLHYLMIQMYALSLWGFYKYITGFTNQK